MITGLQVHQACGLLGWTRYDVNRRTALPLWFVDHILTGQGEGDMTVSENSILRDAFGLAGIDFVTEGDGRPGTRLRMPPPREGSI